MTGKAAESVAPRVAGTPAPSGWGGAWLLLVLALACYAPALTGRFVWDDDGYVVRNRLLDLPFADAMGRLWVTGEAPDYWPLTYTALWAARRMWGLQVVPYHLLNVVLHAGCGVMVWQVSRRLHLPGAWLIAALFVVHPLNVQAVAWVFQVKTTLCGALAGAAAWCWLTAAGDPGARAARAPRGTCGGMWVATATGLFALSLLAKSASLGLPVALLAAQWWRAGRLSRADLLRAAPLGLVAVVLGLVGLHFQHRNILPEAGLASFTPWTRAGQVGRVLGFYLDKAVVPWPLLPIYPKWPVDPPGRGFFLPLVAGVGAAAGLAGWLAARPGSDTARGVAAAGVAAGAMLVPASGAVTLTYHHVAWVADHYAYLALPPLLMVAVGAARAVTAWPATRAAGRVGQRRRTETGRPSGWWAAGARAAAVLLLAALAIRQSSVWRDERTLWGHQVAYAPGEPQGLMLYAGALAADSRAGEALGYAERAVAIRPDGAAENLSAGRAYLALGRRAEAEAAFARSAGAEPPSFRAMLALGELAEGRGDVAAAEQWYHAADQVARDRFGWPLLPAARAALGALKVQQGLFAEAVELLASAVEGAPWLDAARRRLVVALLRQGRSRQAAAHLRELLRRHPADAEALALLRQVEAPPGGPGPAP